MLFCNVQQFCTRIAMFRSNVQQFCTLIALLRCNALQVICYVSLEHILMIKYCMSLIMSVCLCMFNELYPSNWGRLCAWVNQREFAHNSRY